MLNNPSRPDTEKGLMMNMWAVAGFASSGILRAAASIFCRALISPFGLPARPAPPASVSYSRDQEMAA